MSPITKHILTAAATAILIAGCSSNRVATGEETVPEKIDLNSMKLPLHHQGDKAMLPKAILYKTSGDYRDNVPVKLNDDGSLMSYPAPTDIPENATPVELKSGWLLSPVGVGKGTVFTTYTYDEYRKLAEAPAPEEILKAVIPGARVTITIQVPMTLQEALSNPEAVDNYLSPTPRP